MDRQRKSAAAMSGRRTLRYVGEVFRTYILAERGDELCLIDKHAAHERQLFEKLAANYGNVPGQLLLEPLVVELSARKSRLCWPTFPAGKRRTGDRGFWRQHGVLRSVPADVEQQQCRKPAGGDRG